ncbi:MAG: hypothetical protein ACRDD8_09655, partial [Bacteroidales bacterium]
IYDKIAKIKLRFGAHKLFLKLDEKTINNIFGATSIYSFLLTTDQLVKINQLMQFDTESNPILNFQADAESNSIIIGNSTFSYTACTYQDITVDDMSVSIIHKLMECVDKSDSYNVLITDDRLIFKSLDSNSILTICYKF